MRVLLRKIRTASSFSIPQWKIIAAAYYFLLKIRFLLLFFPLPLVERALVQKSKAESSPSFRPTELLNLFRIAWRYQWKRPRCLSTSLAQQLFLAHYGFSAQLRIGVQKKGLGLQAHAWCEETSQAKSRSKTPQNPFQTVEVLPP